MTRKDYVLIADVLKGALVERPDYAAAVTDVAQGFAKRLGRENPRFDIARFLKAAGVQ